MIYYKHKSSLEGIVMGLRYQAPADLAGILELVVDWYVIRPEGLKVIAENDTIFVRLTDLANWEEYKEVCACDYCKGNCKCQSCLFDREALRVL